MKKIIIIGAGPAGIMAALQSTFHSNDVKIIERNKKPAQKLLYTGKGRCNISNYSNPDVHINNIVDNAKFLYSSLSEFDAYSLFAFFSNLGLELKVERGNRIFPASDRARDVQNVLIKELQKENIDIINDFAEKIIIENRKTAGVKLKRNGFLSADKIILAAGGSAYPLTGSDGNGFTLAQNCGHKIVKPRAALVPIRIKENWIKYLKGLKLKNTAVSIYSSSGDKIYEDFGEMEFIKDGISGPVVLSASMYMDFSRSKKFRFSIDLKPALDRKQLDNRLIRDFKKYGDRKFKDGLIDLLPNKLIPTFVELSEITYNKKCSQITASERNKIINLCKNLNLTAVDNFGFSRAIITRGGVSTAEIDPQTMESRLIKNLFFAGEIIDTAALTGGFNLQIAFSTGYKAGKNAKK
ncbi:MAG: NAD(P)/FAD-dependent oxidoreductase [Bacillota bacterium]